MNELEITSRIVLSNIYMMYVKAQAYHWNVEGSNFGEMHDFFGKLYSEVHGSIDTMAEEIRALDLYAPYSIVELIKYATIEDDSSVVSDNRVMLMNLINANNEVIECINRLFNVASANNEQGLADFAAGRIDTHKKHGWMLRSYLK